MPSASREESAVKKKRNYAAGRRRRFLEWARRPNAILKAVVRHSPTARRITKLALVGSLQRGRR